MKTNAFQGKLMALAAIAALAAPLAASAHPPRHPGGGPGRDRFEPQPQAIRCYRWHSPRPCAEPMVFVSAPAPATPWVYYYAPPSPPPPPPPPPRHPHPEFSIVFHF